ncbi:MAG TPA: sulfatase/phosphatase domain-containing protein [Candidatus Polarisedimenticolia bacterium]|nr:sulfatase/phosphatase domain-containing protein [Candidatus Polarisedimenticolia bacterium]
MLTRRTILLAPLALAAQSLRSRVQVVWIKGATVPEEFARESVVFTRAYACCPATGVSRRAVETGRFPHAARPQDVSLADLTSSAAVTPDTITILTAESGDGQDSPSQRSVLVPLAIRWPGKLKPRVADELLISHVDVLPTLLTFLNIAAPEGLQGRDLSRQILRSQGEMPDSVYAEGRLDQPGEWRMLVRGYEKLVIRPREDATRLYNLADDPGEETDLAHDREHELARDSMLALMRQWMRKLGDGMDPSGLRIRN